MKYFRPRKRPPRFENPYAPQAGRIDGFEYETSLHLARAREAIIMEGDREAEYMVSQPYTVSFNVDGERKTITVPSGMLTDLVSVPRIFRFLIGRVGPHLEAAIVHDFLFIAWEALDRPPTREDWDYANRVMIAGLEASKVHPIWRMLIAFALSTPFSWKYFHTPATDANPRYLEMCPFGEGEAETLVEEEARVGYWI